MQCWAAAAEGPSRHMNRQADKSGNVTARALADALDRVVPVILAEDWDNVGLLIGEDDWPADRVLLTIDLTDAVLREAIDAGVNAIVAYHPPIFRPLTQLNSATPASRLALRIAAAHIAVYSPHTALDAAPDGLTDWLAHGFGSGDVRALTAAESIPESEQCKVVTFVPAEHVEAVRNGLASIGAGRIGKYELCSFEIAGRGSFRGMQGAKPRVGTAGHLEHVDEVRLEMVCPKAALGLAVKAIREFHPYEEPPIEFYAQLPRPNRHGGAGRRLVLDQPATLGELASRMKEHLGIANVWATTRIDRTNSYKTIGLCAGAGSSLLDTAIAQGCELFFTGELRHHEALAATARGCAIMLAGHTNTERGYLLELRKRIAALLPGAKITISKHDRDPFQLM
jgi:dinuclear metal center YbgI/SA1388 family protein